MASLLDRLLGRTTEPAAVKATYASSPGAFALDSYPSINIFARDPNMMMNAALGLFRSNPWVHIAEKTISDRFARTDWHLEDLDGNTVEEGGKGISPQELAVQTLFERPSSRLTRRQLWQLTCRHMGLTGNAFWYLDQTNALGNSPLGILYINPVRMTPRIDPAQNLLGWVLDAPENRVTGRQGNPGLPLEASEVIHFTLDEPDFGVWGIGIAEAAQSKVELDRLATMHESQVFASGGRLTGLVSPKLNSGVEVQPEQWQALVREWRNVAQDPDAAKRLIVARGPVDWVQTSSNNEQLQMVELAGKGRDDILNAWGVPLSQVGVTMAGGGLGIGERSKNDEAILWQGAIEPRAESFREKVQYELLDRMPLGLQLVIETPEFDDSTPLFDSAQKAATVPLTNDERREVLGLDPLDPEVYGELGRAVYVMNTMTSIFDPPQGGAPSPSPLIEQPLNPQAPPVPAPNTPTAPEAVPAKATLAERQLLGLRSRVQPVWEKRVRSVVASHLSEQRQTISDNVRQRYAQVVKKPKDRQAWWNAKRWDDSLVSKLEPLLSDYVRSVGTRTTRTLRKATKADGAWLDRVVSLVHSKAGARIGGINDTTRDRVQELVEQGVTDGLGPAALGDLIEEDSIFDEARAELIARTETGLVYNEAALGSYSEFGVEEVEAIDGDGDEECAERDGQIFSLDEADAIEDHPNGTLDWVPVVKAELTEAGMTSDEMRAILDQALAKAGSVLPAMTFQMPSELHVPPTQVDVHVPPAQVEVHVPETQITVNVPEQPPAHINVEVPQVTIEQPNDAKASLPQEVIVTSMPQRVHKLVRTADGQADGSIEADA